MIGKKRKRNKRWVTDDILVLCDKTRDLKKTEKTNHDAADAANQYKEVNSNIEKTMKEAKDQWIIDQCIDIEVGMRKGNSKVAIDILKR